MNLENKACALQVSNITKLYNGKAALTEVNLEIQQGDFVGILGLNGAGKSTLLTIIAALTKASSGSVKIFGYDIESQRRQALSLLGYMPQEVNLGSYDTPFDALVRQAGYFGINREEAIPHAMELLKAVELDKQANSFVTTLSGGMKRRLMLARSLISNPKLLILDEPSSGVDIELRRKIWNLIRSINKKGVTILLTSHYLEEITNMCDKVVLVREGIVGLVKPLKELLRSIESKYYICNLAKALDTKQDFKSVEGIKIIDPLTISVRTSKNHNITSVISNLSQSGIEIVDIFKPDNDLENLIL